MSKSKLIISGITGASAVGFGAFAAHALKSKLASGEITADQLAAFDTASKYQLIHAILLVTVSLYQKEKNSRWLNWAFWSVFYGILLFSCSIYLLTTDELMGLGNLKWLGPITPIGGLSLIFGWICLSIHAMKLTKNESI